MIVIADEITVGVARADLFESPFFAGFENARRGDKDSRFPIPDFGLAAARGVEQRDSLAVFFWVFKFAINRLCAAFQRGFELRQIANENDQLRPLPLVVERLESIWKFLVRADSRRLLQSFNRHRFRCARSFPNSTTISRRKRFNSLTGSKTSPARKFLNSPSLNGVPPSRPSCSRNFSSVQRQLFSLRQRHGGFDFGNMAGFIARDERERFSDAAVDFDFDRPLKFWRVARKTLAQTLVEFGIIRLPDFIADMDAQKIHVTVAEAQFGQFFAGNFEARLLNFVNRVRLLPFRPACLRRKQCRRRV